MNELALFAGAGGGILGGHLLGWRTVCAVEFAAYPRRVLLARQRDGMLPSFPVWDDVRTFDGKPWRGSVDVVSGGFPCQDISIAGPGGGLDGERSGLWEHMARIIGEVRPRFAFVENSPMLTSRGLGRVLGDLAEYGFDAEWCVLGAEDAGAPHPRKRIWILAHATDAHLRGCLHRQTEEQSAEGGLAPQCDTRPGRADVSNAGRTGLQVTRSEPLRAHGKQGGGLPASSDWWAAEPGVVRMVHGSTHRVDRIKSLGNMQVPQVAALAWDTLYQRIETRMNASAIAAASPSVARDTAESATAKPGRPNNTP